MLPPVAVKTSTICGPGPVCQGKNARQLGLCRLCDSEGIELLQQRLRSFLHLDVRLRKHARTHTWR